MEMKELLVEGKSKQIFQSGEPDKIIVHYKDTATAYNEIKIANIANKGIINNQISAIIYEQLEAAGIRTHFIRTLGKRDQLCRKVEIIPVEVIVRNIIAGSMCKRLGIPEGTKPSNTIYDLCYKNKNLGDPLINDHQAVALGLVTYDELEYIYGQTRRINEVLSGLFAKIRITLVDFKIEFGRTPEGGIILADEISPDSCRLWDMDTGKKLDKDRFRRDMGKVIEGYNEILSRLKAEYAPDDCEIHEECGVFGIYNVKDAAQFVYYGLHSLQHRGQEACGIVTVDGEGRMLCKKDEGLVVEVFNQDNLSRLGFHALRYTSPWTIERVENPSRRASKAKTKIPSKASKPKAKVLVKRSAPKKSSKTIKPKTRPKNQEKNSGTRSRKRFRHVQTRTWRCRKETW